MTGRERCDRLKRIRKVLADKMGVDLHQVECTYEGECRGTCPKCKQEEDILNAALLRRGTALAGAAVVATSLAACATVPGSVIESLNGNNNDPKIEDVDVLAGVAEPDPDDIDDGGRDLDGDVADVDIENDDNWTELSGEVAYVDEDYEDDKECPDPDGCNEDCASDKSASGKSSDKADSKPADTGDATITKVGKPIDG